MYGMDSGTLSNIPNVNVRPHLKYHLQPKTKDDILGMQSQFWEVSRESTENKCKSVKQI